MDDRVDDVIIDAVAVEGLEEMEIFADGRTAGKYLKTCEKRTLTPSLLKFNLAQQIKIVNCDVFKNEYFLYKF